MPTTLSCQVIEPKQKAKATVIWLHGLGADGNDFVPIIPQLKLDENLAVKFVFPNAPSIPVTINNGYVMPAWYDILEMDIERKIDHQQLQISAQAIAKLIDQEINAGIPSENIILAGFSQGGAVCYQTALNYPKPLAGLLALSTYLASVENFEVHNANHALPIAIFHGKFDAVVPYSLAQKAHQYLSSKNYACEFKSFAMDHEVCPEEITAISHWFTQQLKHVIPTR